MKASSNGSALFDRMTALADSTRSRLLMVLERHECTVSDLCAVVQLPQSTVSRHLKVLADEGLVASRQDGTRRYYRMAREAAHPSGARLWRVVREQLAGTRAAQQDAHRLETVLARRRERSNQFFSSAAAEWDRVRGELFGRHADTIGLLGLLDDRWTVGDLGCGTGQLSEVLSKFVARVVAVDSSEPMLSAARKRLSGARNVQLRRGELESLPLPEESLDAALLVLVLHHIADPRLAVAEAARTLRPGGRLVIVDMMPHDHEEFRQTMGHIWQGFSRDTVEGWFADELIEGLRYQPLPADPEAKGPALFAASGRVTKTAALPIFSEALELKSA